MVTIGSKKTELRRSYAKLQETSKRSPQTNGWRRSRIALEHNTDDLRQDFLKVYFIANVVFNISRNAFVAQLSFLVIPLFVHFGLVTEESMWQWSTFVFHYSFNPADDSSVLIDRGVCSRRQISLCSCSVRTHCLVTDHYLYVNLSSCVAVVRCGVCELSECSSL